MDKNGFRTFGFRDKLAYAAGDFGCNMSFALKGTLTIFWTQFMGIDSILFAGLLLLVQIWDALPICRYVPVCFRIEVDLDCDPHNPHPTKIPQPEDN